MGIYKFTLIWGKKNLDNILTTKIRHWLNPHPSANISHLKQSTTKFGINLTFASDIYLSCQTRRIL